MRAHCEVAAGSPLAVASSAVRLTARVVQPLIYQMSELILQNMTEHASNDALAEFQIHFTYLKGKYVYV